jgi:PhnB protein
MPTINPYLNFNGNTEEAFNFYKSVFGGEFSSVARYSEMKDVPGCDQISEEDQTKLMHISLPIGKNNVLMGTDVVESFKQPKATGNNFSISVNTENKEEANTLFNRLAEGGTVLMAMADAFWGAYFGMLTDKFGIQWMVHYDYQLEK